MSADEAVLQATDLVIEYRTEHGSVRALDGASLSVHAGEVHALVGESGSGKTTLGMAVGRLLASNADYVSGSLVVAGRSVLSLRPAELEGLRRDSLGFVFQNPIASLDPTMRIGRQMTLAIEGRTADVTTEEALGRVGLGDVDRVLRAFPHELSGGMAQRVSIAMALVRSPQILVADEPTAAVDATLRPQILELLVSLCRERGCALLLLTHDLQAVRAHSTRVSVMFGGAVVESGDTSSVLAAPAHPYTRALLSAQVGHEAPGERVEVIRYVP